MHKTACFFLIYTCIFYLNLFPHHAYIIYFVYTYSHKYKIYLFPSENADEDVKSMRA